MPDLKSKYRFLFIQPFQLPKGWEFADKHHTPGLSKEQLLRMEYLKLDHLLEDVEWDIHFYHGRPGLEEDSTIDQERDKALRGEPSEAVERAVKEAVCSIEEDGAEVITFS